MRNILFLILPLVLLSSELKADTFYYTVVAKSGLSLRVDKSLSSEKLTVVPFKTRVEYLATFKEDKVTVEGIQGFWVYVKYENYQGYMYSGYLYPGEIPYLNVHFVKSDYTILDEYGPEYEEVENGDYQFMNFPQVDRYKNWYGVKIQDKETTLTKVIITHDFTPQKIQPLYELIGNNIEYYLPDGAPLPLEYDVTPNEKFSCFIGTDGVLPDKIATQVFIDKEHEAYGKFLFPWQELYLEKSQYYIQAKGVIEQSEKDNSDPEIMYQYAVKKPQSDIEIIIPLNINRVKLRVEDCVNRQGPTILWAGDINADGIPDLIITPVTTGEGCGTVSNLILVSKAKDGAVAFEVVGAINWNSLGIL